MARAALWLRPRSPALFVPAFLYLFQLQRACARARACACAFPPSRRSGAARSGASLLWIWIRVSRRTPLRSNALKLHLIVVSLYLQVCGIKISHFSFYWGGTTGIKMLIARQRSQTSLGLDVAIKSLRLL